MLLAPCGFTQTWGEIVKVTGSEGVGGDSFGSSVSIDGNYAVIGVPGSDASFAGCAYIFEREGDDWVEVQKLTASDALLGDNFGYSVSIDGDNIIVGASWSNNEGGLDIGAAYIFERDDLGVWTEVQKLNASDATFNDSFGWTVSVSGDNVAIGAPLTDEGAGDAGSTYIFERNDDGMWIEVQKLTASDAIAADWFGYSVSLDEGYIIIGCILSDDDGDGSGSAYVFERNDDGLWLEVQKLTASDGAASAWYGNVVSIDGESAIVGRWLNEGGPELGSAYIYERNDDGVWNEIQKLTPADAAEGDGFGLSVSIDEDYVIVGAAWSDNDSLNSGSAYIFEKNDEGLWDEIEEFIASDEDVSDRFGYSVSISGNHAVVGATFNDDDGVNSGSAYVFQRCSNLAVEVSSEEVCEGDLVVLDGISETGDEVIWTGGVVNGEGFNPPVGTTTYFATGGAEDCEFQVDITVLELPLVEIMADDTALCEGETVTLTASGAITYTWEDEVVDGEAFEPPVGESTFTVTGIGDNDCAATNSILITVYENPEVEFTALEDVLVCLDNGLINLFGTPVDGDFFGDGVEGSVFDPIEAGEGDHTLFYSFVNENGCSAIDSVVITVVDCLGTNELESISFGIYPNPFSDYAVIQFSQDLSNNHQVVIHDALGKIVWKKENVQGSQITLTKAELKAGVYFFSLFESGDLIRTNKLIVQ